MKKLLQGDGGFGFMFRELYYVQSPVKCLTTSIILKEFQFDHSGCSDEDSLGAETFSVEKIHLSDDATSGLEIVEVRKGASAISIDDSDSPDNLENSCHMDTNKNKDNGGRQSDYSSDGGTYAGNNGERERLQQ